MKSFIITKSKNHNIIKILYLKH